MDAQSWLELLAAGEYLLAPGATAAELDIAERRIGAGFPADLRALYQASNGVDDPRGHWRVVWRLDELVEAALEVSVLTKWPTTLLAFGDDGCGDPFCMTLTEPHEVHVWHRIDGESVRLAATLEEFWRGWDSGAIST